MESSSHLLEFPELGRMVEEFDNADRARDDWAFYDYYADEHGIKFPIWIDGYGHYRWGARW